MFVGQMRCALRAQGPDIHPSANASGKSCSIIIPLCLSVSLWDVKVHESTPCFQPTLGIYL